MPLVLNGGSKKTPKELVPKEKVPREKTTTSSDFLYPDEARTKDVTNLEIGNEGATGRQPASIKGLVSFALAQRRAILFLGRRRWLLNESLD